MMTKKRKLLECLNQPTSNIFCYIKSSTWPCEQGVRIEIFIRPTECLYVRRMGWQCITMGFERGEEYRQYKWSKSNRGFIRLQVISKLNVRNGQILTGSYRTND